MVGWNKTLLTVSKNHLTILLLSSHLFEVSLEEGFVPKTFSLASLVVENLSWEIIVWHFTSCLGEAFKHFKQFESDYFHVTKITCPYIITREHTDRWHWCWSKICWIWEYHNEEQRLMYATIITNHLSMYVIVGEGAFLPQPHSFMTTGRPFTICTDTVVLLFTTDCGDRWLDNQSCVMYIYCLWRSVVSWGVFLHCQKSEKKIFFSCLFIFYVTDESKWLANTLKIF